MTRRMLNIKIVVALAMMGFTGGVFASDLPAPDAYGKIVLDTANGEYVATSDVVCTQVLFSANNISVDLSAGGGKTISIPSTVTSDGFAFGAESLSATVLGGVWDFGGHTTNIIGRNYASVSLAFNGTKVRNVEDIQIGDNGKNRCKLILTNEAELAATNMRITGGNVHHCSFEILGGSTAVIANNMFFEEGGAESGTGSNLLRVDGRGSNLSAENASITLGARRSNDQMIVSNKGSVSLRGLAVGGAAGTTGSMLTVDEAALTLRGDLIIGNRGSSANKVEITGASSRFQRANPSGLDPYFGTGGFNEFHVMGGAVITNEFTKDTYIGCQSSNNVVRISNGGAVWQTGDKSLYLGYNYNDGLGCYNTFSVDAGGTNNVNRFIVCGHDNRLVVSNGTFSTRRTGAGSLWIGNPNAGSGTPQNNGVVLRGSLPRLQIPGGLTLQNSSYIRFELTEDGYASGVAPVSVKDLSVDANSSIEVDPDAYVAHLGDVGAKVKLITATGTMTIPDDVIAATNAKMPYRCSIAVEGHDLVLKIRGDKGLILSFR